MDLTKAEYAMYVGTLNAIVQLIESDKPTIKRLKHLLLTEIDSLKEKLIEGTTHGQD